jgi:hypothetical protein
MSCFDGAKMSFSSSPNINAFTINIAIAAIAIIIATHYHNIRNCSMSGQSHFYYDSYKDEI